MKTFNLTFESKLNLKNVQDILNSMNLPHLLSEIKEGGFGSTLNYELQKKTGLKANLLFEYITIENYGTEIMKFL